MVKVIVEENDIKVLCDYNADFVEKAHMLHGVWKKPYWVFEREDEEFVRTALMAVYGEDGRPCDRVTIDMVLDYYGMCGQDDITICGMTVASRPGRDMPVRLAKNARLIAGEFTPRGGSARYPRVDWESGTVVRVRDIPRTIYDYISDADWCRLVTDTDDAKKEKLLKEKETILCRLKEIEDELAKMS